MSPTHNIKHYYVYLLPANANPSFPGPHYEYHAMHLELPKHVRRLTPYWVYSEWEEAFVPINRDGAGAGAGAGLVDRAGACVVAVGDAVRTACGEWKQRRRRREFEKWKKRREQQEEGETAGCVVA